MYKKTTSIQCSTYSETLKSIPLSSNETFKTSRRKLKHKEIHELYQYDLPVYIQAVEGIIGILFAKKPEDTPELFVLHRIVKVKPGILFNLVPLSGMGIVDIDIQEGSSLQEYPIMEFEVNSIRSSFEVDEIFAYYYSTKGNNYRFDGEKHPFWELTFVDNGELECTVDGESFHLPPRSLMFFGPEQFHTQKTAPDKTVSYLTVMFSTHFLQPEALTNRVIQCSNDLYSFRNDLLLGIMKIILVYSIIGDSQSNEDIINPMQAHYENELLNEITQYIKYYIHNSLTINDICTKFAISRSSLQALFKKHLDISPKLHINNVKLEYSKLLLKKSSYTISQISDMLGYTSIHYFSRKFKLVYGITPSEYAKSIAN
jgi:AraC-like DNA-binding protein